MWGTKFFLSHCIGDWPLAYTRACRPTTACAKIELSWLACAHIQTLHVVHVSLGQPFALFDFPSPLLLTWGQTTTFHILFKTAFHHVFLRRPVCLISRVLVRTTFNAVIVLSVYAPHAWTVSLQSTPSLIIKLMVPMPTVLWAAYTGLRLIQLYLISLVSQTTAHNVCLIAVHKC